MKLTALVFTAILVLSCGAKQPTGTTDSDILNTLPHSASGTSWDNSPISGDTEWRFVSHKNLSGDIEVTGAWSLTLKNPSSTDYQVTIGRLVFEDTQGFQIAEYAPILGVETVTVEAGKDNLRKGNFTITLASISLANSITRMGVWASFIGL